MSEREFMDWMAFDELQRRPVEPRQQTLAEQKAQFQLARSDVRSRRGS